MMKHPKPVWRVIACPFFSTRGGACVTASQSILWGLAKDGGLYVPSLFPQISSERLAALCGQSYRQRAARILRDFLEDYSIAEIEQSVDAAYAADAWDHPDVAPVRTLSEGVHVLELFHGPTLAFKGHRAQASAPSGAPGR